MKLQIKCSLKLNSSTFIQADSLISNDNLQLKRSYMRKHNSSDCVLLEIAVHSLR